MVNLSEPMSKPAADAPPALPLDQPVGDLDGVGPARVSELAKLGVKTVGDLLAYFPRDYQMEAGERPIAELVPGQLQSARGEVVAVDYVAGRPARFEATLDDGTGKLALAWFNSAFLRTQIHPGDQLVVQGMVKMFRNLPQMAQGKWSKVEDGDVPGEANATPAVLRPIYPASMKLNSETIAGLIESNLPSWLPHVHEWFADDLLRQRDLIGRPEAYRLIHQPGDWTRAGAARRRLVYDELMVLQLGLGLGKRMRQGRLSAAVLRLDKSLDARIRGRFPFTLTDAQTQAVWQIVRDLQSGVPMNRLLQGDVGSGKTVVALYVMLMTVANKMQAVLLAPTEVLAEQHFLTISRIMAGSGVKVDLYTGRTRRTTRGTNMIGLADGRVHLAIGTQALLQEGVKFANLGLVVVDEQHKLGVQQRAVLKGKGYAPHYLVMTATPIPRTLALSYFADFEVSSIDHLPPGRQPIVTTRVRGNQAAKAYEFIRGQVGLGRQAYIVLPKIDDDGTAEDAKSVTAEYDRLSRGPLNGLRLAMLHGQMPTDEKQSVMDGFRNRKTDVLVATTVIEVGVDVPNATVMVIGDAERFGLSQLHQLRGRVGRGEHESHCILMSDAVGEPAESRLKAMVDTTDGFEIAELDLQLRGPGEFFGTRQHGLPAFKLADLSQEMTLLQQANGDAMAILNDDPRLTAEHHRHLRAALKEYVGDDVTLAQVG